MWLRIARVSSARYSSVSTSSRPSRASRKGASRLSPQKPAPLPTRKVRPSISLQTPRSPSRAGAGRLHLVDAQGEPRGLALPGRDVERGGQDRAGLGRVDDGVDPAACRGVSDIGLAIVACPE